MYKINSWRSLRENWIIIGQILHWSTDNNIYDKRSFYTQKADIKASLHINYEPQSYSLPSRFPDICKWHEHLYALDESSTWTCKIVED